MFLQIYSQSIFFCFILYCLIRSITRSLKLVDGTRIFIHFNIGGVLSLVDEA